MKTPEGYLTTAQAAQILGAGQRHTRALCERGQLEAIPVTRSDGRIRKYLITVESVKRYQQTLLATPRLLPNTRLISRPAWRAA